MELLEKLGVDWKIIIAQIVNFFILLSILYFFLHKPILNILEKRRKKIKKSLQDADAISKKMENVKLETEKVISQAERKALRIIKRTRIQMDKDREKIRREAVREAEKMKKEAREEVRRNKENLIKETQKELGNLIVTLAEKIIKNNLQDINREELNKELIESVKNKKKS
jgi:F-type H+-transporting ATPase subunit b